MGERDDGRSEPAVDSEPTGELTLRTLAMPADANPAGDIFGGWVLSQMDIAAGLYAGQLAQGRVATVAVNAMTFIQPVFIGDVLCVYAETERLGRTSISVNVEAWVLRRSQHGQRLRVTEGIFVFVALDGAGRPTPLPDALRNAE